MNNVKYVLVLKPEKWGEENVECLITRSEFDVIRETQYGLIELPRLNLVIPISRIITIEEQDTRNKRMREKLNEK